MKFLATPMLLLISTPYSQGEEDPVSRQVPSTIREGDGYSSQLEDVITRDHQAPWNVESSIGLQLGNALQDFTAGADNNGQSRVNLLSSIASDPLFGESSDYHTSDPDNYDGDTYEVMIQKLKEENEKLKEENEKLLKEKDEDAAAILNLSRSLSNCESFCRKNLPGNDGLLKGRLVEDEGAGIDVDHGVGDTHVSMSDGEREGRRLVATVSSDKAVLQGIAPSVGSKAGTPAWTSTGDPCNDGWRGVTCDASGYVTQINLGGTTLSGIYLLSFSYWSCIIHIPFTYYISLYDVLHK